MQSNNIVINKKDLIKVQTEIISPTNITKKDVEEFRQRILQSEGCSAKRNYAIVTIMAIDKKSFFISVFPVLFCFRVQR